tara:strand:+ start:853 stop:1314 length:462 start_codon:yes stop_codon:yes gene_type:complete
MKKLIFALVVLISSATVSFAQSGETELLQSLYGLEKKVIIQEFMDLKADQNESFWNVYEAYELERKEIGKARIALLNKYAESFNTLTDEQADKMLKESYSISTKQLKLQKKYYGKMKKATNIKLAARFYQIENYLVTVISFSISDSIPFVENK